MWTVLDMVCSLQRYLCETEMGTGLRGMLSVYDCSNLNERCQVDTFHTFHWGERGDDDVWRAHPGIVEDVRRVLAESAARQGIDWK